MKTSAMRHQAVALERMAGREYFALFMEQGTGKTWCLLADAERLFFAGEIDAMLVIAPAGVHTNWTRREIPTHLGAPHVARAWRSGAGKRAMAGVSEALRPATRRVLRILAINYEAILTKSGYDFCVGFLRAFPRSMVVLDESQRIKNPSAARTKAALRLRAFARFARIATGTPVTNAPLDVFAQMEFLANGLLGTANYRAFVAEYAELLPPSASLIFWTMTASFTIALKPNLSPSFPGMYVSSMCILGMKITTQ